MNNVTRRDIGGEGLKAEYAIVGASGLRSVAKIVIQELIERLKPRPQLLLELYAYGLPGVYYGASYLASPSAPGVEMGRGGVVKLPAVRFYHASVKSRKSREIIIVDGYQAYNSLNQYLVADKVAELLSNLHVRRLFSLGAQTIEEGIRCCATDPHLLAEMRRYGIERTRVDRFIGFSGLVTGMAHLRGIEGVCLFGCTSQSTADPEYPDHSAAAELMVKLSEILELEVDTSILEEKGKVEIKLIEEIIREKEKQEMRKRQEREREESRGYI